MIVVSVTFHHSGLYWRFPYDRSLCNVSSLRSILEVSVVSVTFHHSGLYWRFP